MPAAKVLMRVEKAEAVWHRGCSTHQNGTTISTVGISERFDSAHFLPYTSVFVRDAFSLSGAALDGLESLSWKGIIFGPGTK